jgi:hypothetical protein
MKRWYYIVIIIILIVIYYLWFHKSSDENLELWDKYGQIQGRKISTLNNKGESVDFYVDELMLNDNNEIIAKDKNGKYNKIILE